MTPLSQPPPGREALGHGDVWWADLDKVQPVVVLTRRRVASQLTRILVAPVTTTVRDLQTEVALGKAEGLKPGCVANLDNIQLIPANRLLRRAGRVGPARWREFCRAMAEVMACPAER
ncbi:MAG TPA: type II toxin-antitoxin system PemK/MazF family toxin [Candidatus Nitrosotalea sp.]|nr:type II toxin-antitoxin system PemK/MazF family toxin [Candidatus Nitrosotalea sp.]